MAERGTRETPSEQLAAIIARALRAAGLVPEARVDRLREQLAAGTMKEEDWRIALAEGLPRGEAKAGDEPED